ncbi:MAG: polysaccharide biosynthesis C-terminal domain-containing protein, partial [Oscillospiraceae bacterium]|nr:polysaccharide biosynthesis C-terminal domain-containing protein [Oscillospiraceae bacterium]
MTAKIKSLFGAQDMTVGNPIKQMIMFAIPLLLGNIAQLLYNTVDSIVVGQFVGPDALSATSVSMPIQFMFATLFMTVGTGVSVMVAQYFGAKDKEKLSLTVGSSMILVLITTLFATIVGIPLSGTVMRLMNVPQEVIEIGAVSYLRIMFAGMVGMGFYNILGGILRGLGDSTFPLFVLIGTTVLNIFLDIWMVPTPDKLFGIGLGWGVEGAAWATIISQTLSAFASGMAAADAAATTVSTSSFLLCIPVP